MELIPHGQVGPYLADNGHLPDSHVLPSVTLDDILAAFDPKTRAAFGIWQQAVAQGIDGRGEQINSAFASLQPFVEHTNQLVSLLATQEGALHLLVRNTGVTFNALASRDNQLEQFIVNGERTFHALAEGSTAFAEAFEALPTFEKRSTVALKELDKLSVIANPYLIEFRKAERELSSTLEAAKPFAPQFDKFLTSLGPLTTAAEAGVPKIKTTLNLTTPVLENLRPVLHNLDPFLQYTSQYVPEVQAFFSNLAAATQGQEHSSNAGRQRPEDPRSDHDVRPQPREPGDLREPHRDRPRERLPAARDLQIARERPAGLQQLRLRELGPLGQRAGQRIRLRRTDHADQGIQSGQHAGNPECGPRARVQPAGPLHLQRQNQSVPAGSLREQVMSDDYQYHSEELDLSGSPETGNWSIRCIDVHKRLGGVPVLNGLNVAFPDDTITVVLGPSGTGKSVLIKHMIGLMFPDSGDIIVHGQSVPSLTMPKLLELRRRIGVLFQDGALFGSMSVFDNVAFPLRQHTDMPESVIAEKVNQGLLDVGLGHAMDDSPSQLSGGMRKRAGFARALVMDPDIVIFDEPDSGLDPVRTALLCELIQEMHSIHGGTYIVVTHDIASARRIGEYIALLWRGRIVEAGRRGEDVLLGEPVRAPVPGRSRRGAAHDGLTAARPYANIRSYGRLRLPAPFRAGGQRRWAAGADGPAGGGGAHRARRQLGRRAAGGRGLGGRRGQGREQGDGARGGARPLP